MYINIFTVIVGVVMGVLLFSGLLFENMDVTQRMIFGTIFMGYGIYRYVHVRSKMNQMKRDREIERMKRAQEDLIKSQHKD